MVGRKDKKIKMNMRKLLDLMEATATPRQGVTGQKLAQTSGGQFMNRADRTNQAKVNAALGGAINPATGKPYVAGKADTNLALAKKFSQPAAASTAASPATNVAAPSADNEALKGRTISKAMNPAPAAPDPATAAADTTGAAANAMASRSAPAAPEPATATSTVPASQALDPGEEIVSSPTDTQTAPYNGAAANAMASRSAPAAPEPATAATNAPTATSSTMSPLERQYEIRRQKGLPYTPPAPTATDTKTAQTAPTQTSDQIATAALNAPATDISGTSKNIPAAYGQIAEEELEEENNMELEEMMRLSGLALNEKAPPGAKAERTVKHIKKGYAKDGKLTKKEKGIAYATAWKQHNKEKVNEGMDIMLDEDGHTLKHIVNRFKHETKNFMSTGFMAENLYDALFDYYLDRGDMPYGIAKAREGDPYQWVEEHFYADMGSEMSEGAVAEQTVDPLSELARLAGLSEDGPGAAVLHGQNKTTADKMKSGADSVKDFITKGAEAYKDLYMTGLGMPPDKYTPADPRKPFGPKKSEVDEDGPGSAMLNAPKKDTDSFADRMRSAGKEIRRTIDRATLPAAMRADYDRIEAEKERASAPVATPAVAKADAFKDAIGSGSNKSQADDKLKEMGDSPLARLNQMPQTKGQEPSSGAASSFAPRERERVVSPKIDKYDKEKERAEKARRDIVDRESPDANTFGRKIGKAVSEPIAAIKSAWHGATDAWDHTMGNDTAPDPKPPSSVIPASKWRGDKDNPALKENDELNRMRKIAGLQECGDMGMEHDHMQQKDRLNVTTNMSSDGTKDVTINAQGDKADELLQMLKMAGMRAHDDHDHSSMSEPEVIMISSDDEEMMEADRVTDYSNTPEEEYQTVDSIIRQGNDLNREKRQYKKEYPGDNPMSESLIDADLDAMLESILLRDDADSQNPIQLTPKSYDPKTGADWSGYNITSPKTGRIGARIEPGKDIEYYAADPLPPDDVTGATIKNHGKDVEWHRGSEVDEGWEDVSNFIGDLVGTEASKLRGSQQLRDLDAMRKQYKGTEYEKQVNDRYTTHLDRLQGDKGEVVGKDGEPIKVLPPQQWKGGK